MLRRSRSNVVNLLNGGTIKALPRHPIFMKARGCGKRLLVIPPITFNPLKYDFLVLLSGLYNKTESLKKSNVCCCVWERVDISLIHVFFFVFFAMRELQIKRLPAEYLIYSKKVQPMCEEGFISWSSLQRTKKAFYQTIQMLVRT